MAEVEPTGNISTKGAKQTFSGQDDDDSFFKRPLAGSTLTIENFRNGSFVPELDDLGNQQLTFNAEETNKANLEWKQIRNGEEVNRAKSSDEGVFMLETQLLEAKNISQDNEAFEFNTTAVPDRSETLELTKPMFSPKIKRMSDAESFLIKPNGAKTPTGSLGSSMSLRFNIAVMGDKGSGKTSLIEALVDVNF